ncbi:hypothetical protein JCM19298_1148 [Nonlabens ulvanivorans]|nr:hypothetical protein JCM19298_1148 [Nonlabens ulvanivorans]
MYILGLVLLRYLIVWLAVGGKVYLAFAKAILYHLYHF